jgi:hypothetical protein
MASGVAGAFWLLKEGEEDVVRTCSEASAVMGAAVAYFFLNRWNLKVSPD